MLKKDMFKNFDKATNLNIIKFYLNNLTINLNICFRLFLF